MSRRIRLIDREDMLSLTRRMTPSRNCFSRIVGAYFDEEGNIDGTFNTHFKKLSPAEQAKFLSIAKAVPFSKTNEELREIILEEEDQRPGTLWQCLWALTQCELKNDALLESLYEIIGEKFPAKAPFALIFFYGSFDIPRIGSDKVSQWESEYVYNFIIGAICPVYAEYEVGPTDCGILFPAFTDHAPNIAGIDVFCDEEAPEYKDFWEKMI